MKQQRVTELFEALGEVESTLTEQAYAIDSAEKLKSLCDAQTERYGKSAAKRPLRRRAILLCASLALAFGMLLAALGLPTLLKNAGSLEEFPSLYPEEQPSMGWEDVFANATGDIVINTLDKLNYYAAMYLTARPWEESMQSGQSFLRPLALTMIDEEYDVGYDVDTPPTEDLPPEEQSPAPGDRLPSQGNAGIGSEHWVGDKVVYYGLEPNDRYTIDAVLHLQIELSDPQGFLAAQLGTGIVDVVITYNSLEPMITFRNGDLFYSCLLSGGGNGELIFSTHKYIEGFYIVKNLEQDNFAFNVTFDERGVSEIECRRYKSGAGEEEQIYHPDAITLLPHEGDGVWCEVSGTFSVAELQGYYDAMEAGKGDLS